MAKQIKDWAPEKKTKEKKFRLTFDEILEIVHCARDNELDEHELNIYVSAFLFETGQGGGK